MVMSAAELGLENANDRLILSLERMLHKVYNRKRSFEKNTSRGSQGAWRKDELIGGEQPVVKWL
jgi:hypothetical protein